MAVQQYKKGNTDSLSPNFRVSEFACRGQGCCDTVLIDDALVQHLQAIRDHFGKPVMLNSGYRCPSHNRAVGGVTGSRHLKGQAADISVQGIAPAEVAKYAEQIGILGIGLYETDADGYFVHIDTRPRQSFWYGQKELYRSTFGGFDFSQFIRALQQAIGVTVDGIVGGQTLHAAPTLGIKWNNHHPAIRPVQQYLWSLGYTEVGPADSIAGNCFADAVAHFQRDHALADTGVLEQWGRTWCTLLQLEKGGA